MAVLLLNMWAINWIWRMSRRRSEENRATGPKWEGRFWVLMQKKQRVLTSGYFQGVDRVQNGSHVGGRCANEIRKWKDTISNLASKWEQSPLLKESDPCGFEFWVLTLPYLALKKKKNKNNNSWGLNFLICKMTYIVILRSTLCM